MSDLCDFGLIGLAVMGENLALNVESLATKSPFSIELRTKLTN